MEYKRRTVGFVWQNNARNRVPYLTAVQNVELPMLLNGAHKKRQKALELLDRVGLLKRKNSRLDQMSGGEQQRVAIARAVVINPKLNDIINDLPFECLKGEPYLIETMKSPRPGYDDLKFRIGPVSFFQTNVYQAERLYKTAFDLADVQGDELMYDLYTGTGTIAQYFSRFVNKVVGIEYVQAAIDDAKVNADINGIKNCTFYAGDMAKVFTDDFIASNGRPDFIVTDPPRAGMAEKVVEQLLKIRAKKIVYVSCNPATQARDLQLLDTAYKVMAVQPVDMFPHTQHVENVCLLELR